MHRGHGRGRPRTGALLVGLLACGSGQAEEPAAEPQEVVQQIPRSQWALQTELGGGYDTNANASTSLQAFLGFPLDPRYVATASSFAEASLSADHTLNLTSTSGFITTMEVGHRVNPDATFANQSIVALGTEGIIMRGASRFSAAIGGYASWLYGHGDERGYNFDLSAAHEADDVENAFTLRVGHIGNAQPEFADLEVTRVLAAYSVTRTAIGSKQGYVGLTLVAGHDWTLRSQSPFGNDRLGVQVSGGWQVRAGLQAYFELSALRTDYRDRIFDLDRKDDQLSAVAALELSGWPARDWILSPQLQYVRSDSTVSLFELDRLQAGLYLKRAL